MLDAPPNSKLIAYRKAIDAAGIAIDLVRRVPAPLKSIADQVIRSASSVPANLAEGHGRIGRDRTHHWRIAYASAKEVDELLRKLNSPRRDEASAPAGPTGGATGRLAQSVSVPSASTRN